MKKYDKEAEIERKIKKQLEREGYLVKENVEKKELSSFVASRWSWRKLKHEKWIVTTDGREIIDIKKLSDEEI